MSKGHILDRVTIGLFFFIVLSSTAIFADPDNSSAEDTLIYEMNDVIVTASRTPTLYHDLARAVIVINREDIACGRSIEELLSQASGIDIRRRGAPGVQADVGIRGGSFEQTLILIDGVKVTDPQTGHHNLDLPIGVDEIDRIEILQGPAARLYGPNAFGGVINIITQPVSDRRSLIGLTAGQNGLFEETMVVSAKNGSIFHRAAVERRLSTGHRDNTEYDLLTLSYRNGFETENGRMGLSVRYTDKQFGADRFYSDLFPDEWESTETLFVNADGQWRIGSVTLSPKLFYRRHGDDFVLDRNRPDWYRNRHRTNQYGMEFQSSLTLSQTVIAFGGELTGEEIQSVSLGDHYRLRGGLFFEARFLPTGRLSLATGASVYRYTDWDWRIWPGLDIGYRLGRGLRAFATVGKSFRVPTYTELYYVSPANIGNENLRPEKSWSYEIGFNLNRRAFEGGLSVFLRDGKNLIDWVRSDSNEPWQVHNAASVTTTGVEISAEFYPDRLNSNLPISKMTLRYQYLDTYHDSGEMESKYIADYLTNQIIGGIHHRWTGSIRQNWIIRYLDRQNGEKYVVADSRLFWQYQRIGIFIEAANLFNTAYSEIGGIPMPGRWLKAGFILNLSQ